MQGIDRRSFIKGALAAAGTAGLSSSLLLGGCVTVQKRPQQTSIDKLLGDGARVMWIAAHPDDESLVGSILAKSSLAYRNPLYFLVLTHGEGGECCREEGCGPDLATVRAGEMKHVAELYQAELQHERFFNAPLPVESFPARHELARMWREHKDPTVVCAEAIRRFKPDLIFTFAPNNGFTGHPEHQLASRFSMAGVRMAADHSIDLGGLPAHRTSHVYFGLNKYWPFVLVGKDDPGEVTEIWEADQACINGWECRNIMARFSKAHRSQDRDMGMVRRLVGLLDNIYLHRADPYNVILDPYEPV